METYSESIYGTSASPFPHLPWGWCTVRDQKLYLHVLKQIPDDVLLLPGLHNTVQRAYYLADTSAQIEVQRSGNDITIPFTPEDDVYNENSTVIVLEIVGSPRVDPVIVPQSAEGNIVLDYVTAHTDGNTDHINQGGEDAGKQTGHQQLANGLFC